MAGQQVMPVGIGDEAGVRARGKGEDLLEIFIKEQFERDGAVGGVALPVIAVRETDGGEIDGGVGLNNHHTLVEAGANVLVCGNSVFGTENPVETIDLLKK